ncbi:MAG: VCBS repeat-containing protein [Bacteroidota bacterium]
MMTRRTLALICLSLFYGCGDQANTESARFERVPASISGIDFRNDIRNEEEFNIFSYRNFYNGGGVGLGDINNDGLTDVFLTGNLTQNKLYLNTGDFRFDDITEASGVGGAKAWSTGVVFVDINTDGLLDIYVCNAGYVEGDDHQNELFINNGDLTFTESAESYGLNDDGYTTHAAFFDYDLDGDLDVYILNNSFIPVNTLNYSDKRDLYAEDWPVKDFIKGGGDKLLRNDAGVFKDVTREAGIYGSLIGFGLGITLGDVNEDQLIDLYVSNDFFERDYLYINQGDGTFSEEIKSWMGHISLSSMGADMGDINNDGKPEIFVTEMLPKTDQRIKTTSAFENYQTYQLKQSRDFYHQYMHNTLQYNNGNSTFSEIAWYSGVSATDWSWGALMFDADNDGFRDLYVCNGVYQDVTNQDFIDFFANDVLQKMALTGEKEELDKVVELMPSEPRPNAFFVNNGDLTFEDVGDAYGFGEPTFSNGAAYGDLDNDGDYDLVVNNLNQEAFVYRNNANGEHHFLVIKLKGLASNTFAIGSEINVYAAGQTFATRVIPTRGFQSSVDYKTVIGLGSIEKIDSLTVSWPDLSLTSMRTVPIDTTLVIAQADEQGKKPTSPMVKKETLFREVEHSLSRHKEDEFVDFFQEGLVIRKLSREGPSADAGDLNGDGIEDLIVGGASLQPAQVYLQGTSGWIETSQSAFASDAYYEDTALRLFDMDGDGDLDLYAGSGGNHHRRGAEPLQDRIYRNDGKGGFQLQERALPSSGFNTSVVVPWDIDKDGDLDLFVGSRSTPGVYGLSPRSYIYQNDGKGMFRDLSSRYSSELRSLGMVTDAKLTDVNGDGDQELVIVGEWMAPLVLELVGNKLEVMPTALSSMSGWWYALSTADVDGDGDEDWVLGNRGENFYFTADSTQPARLWLKDFDDNGTVEKIMTRWIDGKDKPLALKRELTEQLPALKKKNLKHAEYAVQGMRDLFSDVELADAQVLEATWFQSIVAINKGEGHFEVQVLPREVQFSCVCDIACTDLNGDGAIDLIMGGNDAGFMPQYSKLDASHGHILINDGEGTFRRMQTVDSGLFIPGDLRQILALEIGDTPHYLFGRNNDYPMIYAVSKP